MLRVVLPLSSLLVKVRLIVIVLVVIVYVLVVHVDVDIAVAPSAIPTPVTAPSGSQRDACSERNRRSRGIIAWGRVGNRRIRVGRWTIDDGWVVGGDVDHVGAGLLNYDDLFALDGLGFHFLLRAGF
jgi:hypothetical protein